MFKNLMKFGTVRTKKEALGFYIAWFAMFLVAGGLLGALLGITGIVEGFEAGLRIGMLMATILSALLSILIVRAKGILGRFSSILFILLSGVLGLLGGALLGLIIPTYLTTRSSNPIESEITS